ncbi:unnamed protein product [Caenorhabditis brenneri]
MVNYWGKFEKNYKRFTKNVEAEARRMKDRIDCLNRLREFQMREHELMQAQSVESSETPVPDEKKKAFLEIIEIIRKMVDSLQNINTLCNPIDGEPHVNPGAHATDIDNLNSNRESIRNQIDSFRQLVADNNDGFSFQLSFLSQMDSILQGRILRSICLELQNVVDGGDSGRVKQYGEMAGSLLQQIDAFLFELDWNTRNPNVESEILPSEPPGDNNNTSI